MWALDIENVNVDIASPNGWGRLALSAQDQHTVKNGEIKLIMAQCKS